MTRVGSSHGRWARLVAVALFAAVLAVGPGGSAARAEDPRTPLVGAPVPLAPDVRWPGGARDGLDPAGLRGRVIVLLFFQGDSEDGLAAAAAALRGASDPGDVALVAVQWMGWRSAPLASADAGRDLLARHGLSAMHATWTGRPERPSDTPFARFGVQSLPWRVVADRAGVVRYEGGAAGFSRLRAEVESLRAWPAAANPMVGRAFGDLRGLRFLTPDGRPFVFAERPLTLLRWWTHGCPFCTDSLPALARLEARYAARGLRLAAVYHPKGRPLSDPAAREYARRLGVTGTLAFDDQWAKYLELQRRGGLRKATSISVLVDAEGIVRWVHPGPRIHEARGGRFPEAEADLRTLDSLLDRLLPGEHGR